MANRRENSKRFEGIPVEDSRRNISVFLGLVPDLADESAVVGAEESAFAIFIGRHGGDSRGDCRGGSSRL